MFRNIYLIFQFFKFLHNLYAWVCDKHNALGGLVKASITDLFMYLRQRSCYIEGKQCTREGLILFNASVGLMQGSANYRMIIIAGNEPAAERAGSDCSACRPPRGMFYGQVHSPSTPTN